MKEKPCKKCGVVKPLSEYYADSHMVDNCVNICKPCIIHRNRINYLRNQANPEFMDKQRDRRRNNYQKRYANTPVVKGEAVRISKYRKEYPEKYIAVNRASYIPINPGYDRHHWSYNPEHYMDVIILSKREHVFLHTYITYDKSVMKYRITETGQLLDTKEKHQEFINSLALLMEAEWQRLDDIKNSYKLSNGV